MRFLGCKSALKYVWVGSYVPDPAMGAYGAPETPNWIEGGRSTSKGKGGEASPKQKFTTTPLVVIPSHLTLSQLVMYVSK